MSLIVCYDGFNLRHINLEKYIDLIQKSIEELSAFGIECKGLTASSSCVMMQGFPENNVLEQIRHCLRTNFNNSNLQQSLDKRYKIKAAHSTVLRFRKQLNDKDEFLKFIEQHRNDFFGHFSVDTLELVFNDWYQRKKKVKTLHLFKLE